MCSSRHETLFYYMSKSWLWDPLEHVAGPKDTEFLFDISMEAVDAYKQKKEYHLRGEIYKHSMAYKSDIGKTVTCFKPKKVVLLGSGGLSIGQAGEFDYSGSQVNIYLNFKDSSGSISW